MKRKSLENQSSERFWWLRRIAFILIILSVIFGIDATKHRLQPTFLKTLQIIFHMVLKQSEISKTFNIIQEANGKIGQLKV